MSAFAQKSEEKLVRKAFDNYKTAVLNKQGEQAVNYVSAKTIDYYSNMLELVKTADSTTIDRLQLMDKLMVLTVRLRIPKEEILKFDGKSFLEYGISNGMIGNIANFSIGDVKITGDTAKGQFMVGKEKAPFYYDFYKENGQWKIDLTSILAISETAFSAMIQESGQTENEILLLLLEKIAGAKPDNTMWQPIL